MNPGTGLKTVELLAPGGSMEGIYAAVHAGADAIYAGGKAFGARAYAQNPEQDDLFAAIDYCHLHGVRLYLTVNTLLKERELESALYDYMAPVCEHGVDAVLVQDFGVFQFLRQHFPDLPLHASTQMTVTGADGVRLLEEMGAERVVLSRELSLEEIRQIRSQTHAELETFVHGALCYCYSGQCLMSSMIGGRSGNRGRCAQPCRLPYTLENDPAGGDGRKDGASGTGGRNAASGARGRNGVSGDGAGRISRKTEPENLLLSLKDICTLRILPDLIDAGIASLKIEGRMKSPEYAAGVTAMYRKYIDLYLEQGRDVYRVDPADEALLQQLFSRGPFSGGYYDTRNGRQMLVLREQKKEKGDRLRASQEAVARIHDRYVARGGKLEVTGAVRLHAGEPMTLTLRDSGGVSASAQGAEPMEAKSRPLDEASVRKQIGKTGDTIYAFSDLTVDMEDSLFVPLRDLNELRRQALENLQEAVLAGYRRPRYGSGDSLDSSGAVRKTPESAEEKTGIEGIAKSAADKDGSDRIPEDPAPDTAGTEGTPAHPGVTASVCTLPQLEAVLEDTRIGGIYLDFPLWSQENLRRVRESGRKAWLMLPPVWRADTVKACEKAGLSNLLADADGALLRSFDQIGYLRSHAGFEAGKEYIADAGMYTWNRRARGVLQSLGMTMDTLPFELTRQELEARGCGGSECVIYGHQLLMISAQCPNKTVNGCTHRSGIHYLKDRMGAHFPVRNECGICTNLIYNSVPLDLVTMPDVISRLQPASVRYGFTIESGEAAARVLRGQMPAQITRGHIRKGVE